MYKVLSTFSQIPSTYSCWMPARNVVFLLQYVDVISAKNNTWLEALGAVYLSSNLSFFQASKKSGKQSLKHSKGSAILLLLSAVSLYSRCSSSLFPTFLVRISEYLSRLRLQRALPPPPGPAGCGAAPPAGGLRGHPQAAPGEPQGLGAGAQNKGARSAARPRPVGPPSLTGPGAAQHARRDKAVVCAVWQRSFVRLQQYRRQEIGSTPLCYRSARIVSVLLFWLPEVIILAQAMQELQNQLGWMAKGEAEQRQFLSMTHVLPVNALCFLYYLNNIPAAACERGQSYCLWFIGSNHSYRAFRFPLSIYSSVWLNLLWSCLIRKFWFTCKPV